MGPASPSGLCRLPRLPVHQPLLVQRRIGEAVAPAVGRHLRITPLEEQPPVLLLRQMRTVVEAGGLASYNFV